MPEGVDYLGPPLQIRTEPPADKKYFQNYSLPMSPAPVPVFHPSSYQMARIPTDNSYEYLSNTLVPFIHLPLATDLQLPSIRGPQINFQDRFGQPNLTHSSYPGYEVARTGWQFEGSHCPYHETPARVEHVMSSSTMADGSHSSLPDHIPQNEGVRKRKRDTQNSHMDEYSTSSNFHADHQHRPHSWSYPRSVNDPANLLGSSNTPFVLNGPEALADNPFISPPAQRHASYGDMSTQLIPVGHHHKRGGKNRGGGILME
jgi:hypothetical protein